jgi:hypothetical protein
LRQGEQIALKSDDITDVFGGLLIREYGYNYPVWFDGISRDTIRYSKHKAFSLKAGYTKNS